MWHAFLLFFLLGNVMLYIGSDIIDMRYASPLWPALILLASPAISETMARRGGQWLGGAILYATAGVITFTLVLNRLAHHAYISFTGMGLLADQVAPNLYGGLAVAILIVGLGGWFGVRRRDEMRCLALSWDILVAAGIAMGIALQLILQFTIAKRPEAVVSGPWLFPPFEYLQRAVHWIIYSLE